MNKDILLLQKNLGALIPLIAGEEACEPGHSFGPARREYHLLHFVLEGKGIYRCRGTEHPVEAGQIFVIRPEELTEYRADTEEPWHYIWVGFRIGEALRREFDELLEQDIFTAPDTRQIFLDLMASDRMQSSRELYVCGKVYELLSVLQESSGKARSEGANYVLRAKNYVEANYVNDISVQSIANYLGLSRSYFSAVFKQSEGVSPQEFIVDFRLRKACQLISQQGYRPGEAAVACGYTDIFNFSKMFKKRFGASPGKFRRKE